MPNLSANLSGYGDVNAVSVTTTGDVTVGDDIILTGEINGWYIYSGSADPTAGGGVAHTEPALYLRSGSPNQIWYSTGAGATSWGKVQPTASPVFTGTLSADLFSGQAALSHTIFSGYTRFSANTPTTLNANTDNWAPGSYTILRTSTSAAYDITGLVAAGGGQIVYLVNVGSFNITLKNDVTSTAANRFLCTSGADIVVTPGRVAFGFYDNTSARWRVSLL